MGQKNQTGRRFSVAKRLHSIRYACEGVRSFFREEHNAWIHLCATGVVIIMAITFQVSLQEATILAIVTAFVWSAELLNTAIERLCDLFSKETDARIKLVKDIAAAAVLVASIAALVTGCFIFIPKF